jgi:predicted RNA polymerase sigma factor
MNTSRPALACARRPHLSRRGRRVPAPRADRIHIFAADIGLERFVRDVDRAANLAQQTLLTALEYWPEAGTPTTLTRG